MDIPSIFTAAALLVDVMLCRRNVYGELGSRRVFKWLSGIQGIQPQREFASTRSLQVSPLRSIQCHLGRHL